MGGDEFEILYPGASQKDVDDLCAELHAKAIQRDCSFAIGYAEHDRNTDINEVQKSADKMMYENKAEFKRAAALNKLT